MAIGNSCRTFISLILFLLLISISAVADTTVRVSVSSSGDQGNSLSLAPCISADGKYAAFYSDASNLVPGDTNADNDVFVRNLTTGITERLSVSSIGDQGNSGSLTPSISGDGRYIAFMSDASNLVPGDVNDTRDIFVRDTLTGTTDLVSVSSSGIQGNSICLFPCISADGRYVAFFSYSSNLVPGDTNGAGDIFVRDLSTNTTERASVAVDGNQGNSDSDCPCISADGRYTAFYSYASNLVADDTNEAGDVFIRDRVTGTTELVSVATTGDKGNSNSNYPSISADGRYTAFYSSASNLVPGDTNGAGDIFVRDRVMGTTQRVSISDTGDQSNSDSYAPAISPDGRFIAFHSNASNLVSGDTNGVSDVFVRDLLTGTTERMSVSTAGDQGNINSYAPSISADGKSVVFVSNAANLVTEDTNGQSDIFMRKRSDQPVNLNLTPDSGSIAVDQRTTLTSVYVDPGGANNLKTCYLLVNTSFSNDAGYLFYNVAKNKLYLRPTDSIVLIGGFPPGKARVIDNGCILLNCARTTVQRIGNKLVINWSVTFKPKFTGTICNAWMRVTNKAALFDPWKQMGSFPMVSNPAPRNDSLTPDTGTITADNKTYFATSYSDPNGYANIKTCYLMFRTGAAKSDAGYFYYDSVRNKLYLRKTDEAVMIGGYAPGSGHVIDNGKVVLYCADTNVQKIGNNIVINWGIALKSYFAGKQCMALMQVTNKTGQSDSMEQMGLFSVD